MSDNDQNGSLYISKHGVSYISFHNMNNCLCFFNTSLHLLKTSKTLTNLLADKVIQDKALKEFPILMEPLCYYNNDYDKVLIEQSIHKASASIVYNGYVVEWLLNNYYFPIIYYLANSHGQSNSGDNTILNIWGEMSMEKHLLKKTDTYNVFNQQQQPLLEDIRRAYNKALTSLLNKYDDTNLTYECVIMEVYPQANNQNAHVVAVIDGEYILDREKVCTFSKYISEEIIDFYKFRFDYVSKTFANFIKGIPLSKHLYSYVYENKAKPTTVFTGGYTNNKNKTCLLAVLVMFLVVVCVVVIVVSMCLVCFARAGFHCSHME